MAIETKRISAAGLTNWTFSSDAREIVPSGFHYHVLVGLWRIYGAWDDFFRRLLPLLL
jgi:hypothetical protein